MKNTTFSPQQEDVLMRLLQGKTTMHELQMIGMVNPATRMTELRKMGFVIDCTLEPYVNKRGATIKRGVYRLDFVPLEYRKHPIFQNARFDKHKE